MVIRLVAHGDLLIPDALAQFAVCELDRGNGAAGRLLLEDPAYPKQGGKAIHNTQQRTTLK